MTKLQELKGRLELLPEKHRLKTLVGKLTEYSTQVAAAARVLEDAVSDEGNVRLVFGDDASTVAGEEKKRAGRVSKRMATKLRGRIEAVSDAKARVNDDVTAINDGAAKAARDVKQAWQRLLDQRLRPYERLAEVATQLKLAGAGDLSQTMSSLRAARGAVPGNAQRAAGVSALLLGLPVAVQNLGLKDEAVQRFLIDATQGTAKLKAFHDTKGVADFISKNDLWELFRVNTLSVTGHAR
jgi:hypothetical protein